ncbi:SET domain protein (macronuclear) [Tetrahymena thermophila SB210]|uniref:SET domain protein n=1 Tax=Tetrahymena thermophila (strain SB210) TaxID=312017 RepID=I7M9J9_TETTS|nr:SET domain protein [Tetrahymena thermophila SB210]EAS01979.2 SET domain protein [Tetrahymena thermophila SB210]|eukprot:XP_001022224.2 SET domain protein [Tetrahymena thermophila SB210]
MQQPNKDTISDFIDQKQEKIIEKVLNISITQQEPNEKYLKSMEIIQKATQKFFNDLCLQIIRLSIWSYKMRRVRQNKCLKYQIQKKESIAKQFFNNWKNKPYLKKKQLHIIDKSNDVIQSNMYSNYMPVSQNVQTDDFLLQLFPVIERIDLYQIVNELKMKESLSEKKRFKKWFKIIKKMNLLVDIEQKIWIWYIYKTYKKTLGCTSFMQIFFQQPQVKQQNFALKYLDIKRMVEQKEYKYGITIEKKNNEHIDPIIDLTAMSKQYYCNICYIYDCRIHFYERKKGQDFYHPSTFVQNTQQYSERMIQYLVDIYQKMVFDINYSFMPTQADTYCGKFCYKRLTKEKIKQIKESLNYPIQFSDLDKLFIKLGEQRFYFNICQMSLLQLSFRCDLLFIYLVEQFMQSYESENFQILNDQFKQKQDQIQLKQEQNLMSNSILNQSSNTPNTSQQKFQVKKNFDDNDDDEDPWLLEEEENENEINPSQYENTQKQLNLAEKLKLKVEEDNNQNFMHKLKEFVVSNYTVQEVNIKQEKIKQEKLKALIRKSQSFLVKPEVMQEESDEDEGLQKENNQQKKGDKESKEDQDECYGYTNTQNETQLDDSYQHCVHYRHNRKPVDTSCKKCCCRKRGFCDQYCMCDPKKCKIYRFGCNCQDNCSKNTCICFKRNVECDPDICKSCFECKSKCNNNQITLNKVQRVVIANSEICGGLGIYNVYPLQKGDLITIYYGEVLQDLDIIIRDSWKPSNLFYIFSLLGDLTVDSKYIGNKSRFMNHSKSKENSYAKMVYAKGGYTIGLFSNEKIIPGTELLFDYDGQGTLKLKYEWIMQKADSKAKQIQEDNIIVFEAHNSPAKNQNLIKQKKRK